MFYRKCIKEEKKNKIQKRTIKAQKTTIFRVTATLYIYLHALHLATSQKRFQCRNISGTLYWPLYGCVCLHFRPIYFKNLQNNPIFSFLLKSIGGVNVAFSQDTKKMFACSDNVCACRRLSTFRYHVFFCC